MPLYKILIVEDEAIIALNLKTTLEYSGYEDIYIASTAEEAVELAKAFIPDIIIMDILLKGKKTGIDASFNILKYSSIPIIFVTGNVHLLDEIKFNITSPYRIFSKPPPEKELLETIQELLN